MNLVLGLLLGPLPIFFLPIMTASHDFPDRLEPSWPGGIVTSSVSTSSGRTGGTDQKYSGLGRFLKPGGVKLDKIYRILKDFETGLSQREEQKLAQLIYKESFRYQYDPELILAVIAAESSFYNWSRSRAGAIGLMQILPTTGFSLAKARNINWMGNATLYDPYINIKLGIKYLAMMDDQFDDLETALTAYNYGPTRVSKMIRRCDRLPMAYSQKVLTNYQKFLELDLQDVVES